MDILRVTPPALIFDFVERDTVLAKRVTLTDHHGEPLTLSEITVDPAGSLTVAHESDDPAGGLTFAVRPDRADLAPGTTNATVTLTTADGGTSVLPVHIRNRP